IKKYEFENKQYLENISDLQNQINSLKTELDKEKCRIKQNNSHHDDELQINFDAIEKDNFINNISETDILSLNPMEAMNLLYKFVGEAKKIIR
ncbi:MAG: hypothetical protein ACI398_09295, partial [Clostridium sp.]